MLKLAFLFATNIYIQINFLFLKHRGNTRSLAVLPTGLPLWIGATEGVVLGHSKVLHAQVQWKAAKTLPSCRSNFCNTLSVIPCDFFSFWKFSFIFIKTTFFFSFFFCFHFHFCLLRLFLWDTQLYLGYNFHTLTDGVFCQNLLFWHFKIFLLFYVVSTHPLCIG